MLPPFKAIGLALCIYILPGQTAESATNSFNLKDLSVIRHSVFKVRVVSQGPDPLNPWLTKSIGTSAGTGFYIGAGRILTNAHVVDHARFITVQRGGSPRSAPATIKYIAHDADLALLVVEDQSYLKDVVPLQFGPLPALHSPISAIGYPVGGEKVSITEGVVSRIDTRLYMHSGYYEHLLIQVDSAINPGNSGGPVMQGGRAVGVAFQIMTSAHSTGYVIPAVVVERFLRDVEDGRYDGHPDLGIRIQSRALLNAAAASFYQLPKNSSGVLVSNVAPFGAAADSLKIGDVLLSINGRTIDFDGRILFKGERIDYDTEFDLRQVGEEVTFDVLREGRRVKVAVVAKARSQSYFPGWSHAERFPYVVYAGLVFTNLSRDYLRTFGQGWLSKAPIALRYLHRTYDSNPTVLYRDDVVVLASRLPHPINEYEAAHSGSVVTSVNGTSVRSLRQMSTLLNDPEGGIVTINFAGDVEPISLDKSATLMANRDIQRLYGLVADHWFYPTDAAQVVETEGRIP